MPNGNLGTVWEVAGVGGAVAGAGEAKTMAVGEDIPLAVTIVLARPVLEQPL